MGSTLSTLKTGLNNVLGVAETTFKTEEKRTDAINFGIRECLLRYDLPQYVTTETLSFTSGVASLPTGCLAPQKLFASTSPRLPYRRVNPDEFDAQVSRTYKIAYDTATDVEKVYIYQATTTSLSFRYLKLVNLSATGDTIRLNPWWDKPIVTFAAAHLWRAERRYDLAEELEKEADNQAAAAWQLESQRWQGKEDTRLHSVYENNSILSSWNPRNA